MSEESQEITSDVWSWEASNTARVLRIPDWAKTISLTISLPVCARWHEIKERWCLVDEADGEVLALIYEELGIYAVVVDDLPAERYLTLTQAKAAAEDRAGPLSVVTAPRHVGTQIP